MQRLVILCASICAALSVSACVPVLESPGGGTDACGEYTPPENDWPINEVPADFCGTGWSEGEVLPDARLMDQHEQELSLWQFYGDVLVIDISTQWCGPCQALAAGVQATADDYREEGVEYITVLVEDLDGNATETDDLNAWGDYYGIIEPIVSDTANISPSMLPGSGYPGVFIIGRDMTNLGQVTIPQTGQDEAVRAAIDAAL